MHIVAQLKDRTTLMSVSETAAVIGVHVVTLRDWVREGRIPAIRVGNRWAVDPGDLAEWLVARRSAM
jgi:excisionase family DNA binding protein